jgi:predicted nucleic acid-binding protein
MIVLDSTAVVALQDRRDRWYPVALEAVRDEPGPFVVPLAVIPEVDAVLADRSAGAMAHVLGAVLDGSLLVDAGEGDIPRIAALTAGGPAAPRLGFADAAVAACAERNGCPLLTFSRVFDGLARDGVVSLVPLSP